ncbi:hypothetical protein [Flavobacterium tistrianum]|uniref:hypothetical protein n=1 Tax=Flavobacterium tistrianum TaxID=1685414 RepID=UPI0013A648DD|nr:hypothetical protein [Flavobacterium tistrianum]KAF2342908.1 hypothetical protein DMB71_01545 [Flavobacterium tistrianum]
MEFIFKIPYLKIALVFFVIVSIPVVCIMWKNPSAEGNSTHIFTLLGAVLLVIISVVPYLQIDKKTEFGNITIFRDNTTQKIVSDLFEDPYFLIYTQLFNTVEGKGTFKQMEYESPKEAEDDLVEKAVLFQLLADFNGRDWDSEFVYSEGVYGNGSRGSMAIGTGSENKLVDGAELHKIFSGNSYLNDQSKYQSYALRIPADMTIKRIHNGSWAIIFENSEFKMVIQQAGISSSSLVRGAWGIFKGDPEVLNRYTQTQYTIMIHAGTKFGNRYTERTASYWKWFEGVSESIKKYNWQNVDKAVLERKMRDSVWQDVSKYPPGFLEGKDVVH